MSPEWNNFINDEMKKKYMIDLKNFITERRKEVIVLPSSENLFNALKQCAWADLKVIIIGQDPYPSAADAHGIAFSSPSEKTPYSLENIFKEIYQDIFAGNTGGVKVFKTNNLTQWAKQGVLLLNTCLTTEENKPGAHNRQGWEIFIENLVKHIGNHHKSKLVWMLWGKQAQSLKEHINQENHLVLEAEHPAAVRHRTNAWFGNKNFSKCNEFIKKTYFNQKSPINWHTLN